MRSRFAALLLALAAVLGMGLIVAPAASAAAAGARCTVTPTTIWASADVRLTSGRYLDAIAYGWYTDPDQVRLWIYGPNGGLQHSQTLYPRNYAGAGYVFNFPNSNYIPVNSYVNLQVSYGGSYCNDYGNRFY